MIYLLQLAHIGLFLLMLRLDSRRGVNRLRCLAVPIGLCFLYTSVIQAQASVRDVVPDLTIYDIKVALCVSFFSYMTFLVGYHYTPLYRRKPFIHDHRMIPRRLNQAGWFCFLAGAAGYYMSIRAVGGLRAFLHLESWQGDLYQTSGYVYMLKYAIGAAVALWILSYALNGLSRWMKVLLGSVLAALLFEAIQSTSRGDTVTAAFFIICWIYFAGQRPAKHTKPAFWGKAAIITILFGLGIAVVILPEFRTGRRSLLTSENTLDDALQQAQERHGSSRYGEYGGEFDTAARIIKRVNAGEFNHPGPVHIASWLWNAVPRALVPQKHALFSDWAGPNYRALQACKSYDGCSPTGWGEAYGTMGWFGALIYWLVLGLGLKRLEGWIGTTKTGFVISASSYYSLLELVIQDFWGGAMTVSIMVIPFLVLLWLSQEHRSITRRRLRKENYLRQPTPRGRFPNQAN